MNQNESIPLNSTSNDYIPNYDKNYEPDYAADYNPDPSTPLNNSKHSKLHHLHHYFDDDSHLGQVKVVIQKECSPGVVCGYMWIWKFIFWALDALNVYILLLLTKQAYQQTGNNEFYYSAIVYLLIAIIIYYVSMEVFHFFGCGKVMKNYFGGKDMICCCLGSTFLATILIVIPIVLIFSLVICFYSILVDEGVLSYYSYEIDAYTPVLYGTEGGLIGLTYAMFLMFYPFTAIRPNRFAIFLTCFCCAGLKVSDDYEEVKIGCIAVGDGDSAACSCDRNINYAHLFYFIFLIIRFVTLSMGLWLFFYITNY